MEEKNYPYLGTRKYKDQEYVVLFTEKDFGVIVMSDIQDNEDLRFGKMNDFSESMFTPLEPERCVRLSN